MSETNFLESIRETEGVADEMIFNAKAAMKDQINDARKQAAEIIDKAKSEAAIQHKKHLDNASGEAAAVRQSAVEDAEKEADSIRLEASKLLKTAAERTAEGIVKIFGDR